jgi:hypothetical protein
MGFARRALVTLEGIVAFPAVAPFATVMFGLSAAVQWSPAQYGPNGAPENAFIAAGIVGGSVSLFRAYRAFLRGAKQLDRDGRVSPYRMLHYEQWPCASHAYRMAAIFSGHGSEYKATRAKATELRLNRARRHVPSSPPRTY